MAQWTSQCYLTLCVVTTIPLLRLPCRPLPVPVRGRCPLLHEQYAPSNGNGIVVKRNLFNDSWMAIPGASWCYYYNYYLQPLCSVAFALAPAPAAAVVTVDFPLCLSWHYCSSVSALGLYIYRPPYRHCCGYTWNKSPSRYCINDVREAKSEGVNFCPKQEPTEPYKVRFNATCRISLRPQ